MRPKYDLNSPNIPYYYYPWYDVYHMYNAGNVPRYPDLDPTQFTQSAEAFRDLLNDASDILRQLSNSEKFAYEVMDAAQHSETQKVKQLLESTGIHNQVEVQYNPDGIKMTMRTNTQGTDCCHLSMNLRW
ncbi:hypothetical protein E3U55_08085 [Filobacillus milosensis]|uniref:Uncharacterized protein n=1 Tax=Filobacillus milosensis TaxID=94137 RepID=A0A4Y8ISM7_9BACI|nr:hypothetical protein [Filobacillus milosensis]TFB21777.1 hypothetical protein E3U55_08085 [Filobacillus milosensis]